MRKSAAWIVALGLVFSCYSFAGEYTVFGPKQFSRGNGTPVTETVSFASPVTGSGFKLKANNGEAPGTGRTSSGTIALNGEAVANPSDFNQQVDSLERIVPLSSSNNLSVQLNSQPGSSLTLSVTGEDNDPPDLTITAPANGSLLTTASVDVVGTVIDATPVSVNINGVPAVIVGQTFSVAALPLTFGENRFTASATDLGGNTANYSITVIRKDITPPQLAIITPADGSTTEEETIAISGTVQDDTPVTVQVNGLDATVSGQTFSAPEVPLAAGSNSLTVTATDAWGNTTSINITVIRQLPRPRVEPQPAGSFGSQYQDLIPADATKTAYDPKRFALITGEVRDISNQPITDVIVSAGANSCVECHGLEYGSVRTDATGRFTLPVEGGSTMTVVYKKDGLITSHRQVYVPWNGYAVTDTLQLLPQDDAATTIAFDGNPQTVVTHRSTPVSDTFGTRAATLVLGGDNQAYEVDAFGQVVRPLAGITVRATEFVTPESMPANLPPTSAYTYCAEFSVDGAQRVKFTKPVVAWVDNFLGFQVGEVVPVGYYDRDRGVWIPSDNGKVVLLLDTDADGIVDALDSNRDSLPDDLNGNGSFRDEVKGLEDASRYRPGTSYWRFSVSHFTPWDCNWPYGPPPGAIEPNPPWKPSMSEQLEDEQDCQSAISSFVEDRSRIFHEDIPIPGTDMTLHYASNRVEGYQAELTVPLSGATVPSSLKGIVVELSVAGRTYRDNYPPLPNQKAQFSWDGLDQQGRPVTGPVTANVRIGFVYDLYYYSAPSSFQASFGQVGENITPVRGRSEMISWSSKYVQLRSNWSNSMGEGSLAEGWTLSTQHRIHLGDIGTMQKGDGTIANNNAYIINTVAGGGDGVDDEGSATAARLYAPVDIALDGKGNLYIADQGHRKILKVDPSGTITTIAGVSGPTDETLYSGVKATETYLGFPKGIAADEQGNIYVSISQAYGMFIRKIDQNGIIYNIAGKSSYQAIGAFTGDGGLATSASLSSPTGLAVAPTGDIYVADQTNYRIRKIDTNGIITTVAGSGPNATWYGGSYGGDGDLATKAKLRQPTSVAVDAAGNLFIADSVNHRIRKVDVSGRISTIAGTGTRGYGGDGGPAISANLSVPRKVTIDALGNLFIVDYGNKRVRKIDNQGIITTVAYSGGSSAVLGDGGPPLETSGRPFSLAVDAGNNLYILDDIHNRIRKVAPHSSFKDVYASNNLPFIEKNGQGHVFSAEGIHQQTVDLNTGSILRQFSYDGEGRTTAITDRWGQVTQVRWDGNGKPTAIVSPDNLETALSVDGNNHLTRVTYPDGGAYRFEYTSDGLMTAEIDPNGNRFEHRFSAGGQLTDVFDPEGGHWTYTRSTYPNGQVQVKKTTGEGNATTYLDRTDSTGAYTSTITGPSGGVTTFTRTADGLTETSALSCGMNVVSKYGLDPEYKFKFVKEQTESTPAGKSRLTLRNKSYLDTDADQVPDRITGTITLNGKITTLLDDTLAAKREATSPLGRKVTSFYEPATLQMKRLSVVGFHDVLYDYDAKGRLTSLGQGERQTAFAYGDQGYLASITDPEGRTTHYETDAMGRILAIRRPDGSGVGFDYDDNGNMTVLANPASVTHGFDYNGVDAKTGYTTPLNGSYRYFYDKDRRLVETRFPSGRQIFNLYDKDRLAKIISPEGDVTLNYLCATKLGSMSKGGETLSYAYDGKLVTSETKSGTLSQTLAYAYNNDFAVTSFTYAGATANFTYDNDRLLTGSSGFTITRDSANGLPKTVSGGTFSLARSFNEYGEVSGETMSIGGLSRFDYSLSRFPAGRISAKTEAVSGAAINYAYTYDDLGRLQTVTKDGALVEQYQYDAIGRRIYEMNSQRDIAGRSFVYSDEDHLLTAGNASYQYDLDGFLTAKTDAAGTTAYTYSSRGELLKVVLPEGKIIEYVHDPQGRRIVKKVNGVIVEKYLWQGLTRLLAVYDGSNSLLMRFQYAADWVPVAMTVSGTTYYFGYDQVGSLRVVSDASGNIVKKVDYDSFGNILTDSSPAFIVPFDFAGGLHDRDTGLVLFGYRDYSPEIGRWTAKDPIGFSSGDIDFFGYVQNNPVNWIDPNGLLGIPISAIKNALKKVHEKVGRLPKGEPGSFGSPQAGTPTKGYRLDPGHPDKPPGDPEAGPHINWWDYSEKKRKNGGPHGAEPIVGTILGFLGSMLDPFDAIAGDLASDEELMEEFYNNHPLPCE